jgi:hypothetical protein
MPRIVRVATYLAGSEEVVLVLQLAEQRLQVSLSLRHRAVGEAQLPAVLANARARRGIGPLRLEPL